MSSGTGVLTSVSIPLVSVRTLSFFELTGLPLSVEFNKRINTSVRVLLRVPSFLIPESTASFLFRIRSKVESI